MANGSVEKVVQRTLGTEIRIKLEWETGAEDAVNNTTIVNWKVTFYAVNGGFYVWDKEQPWTFTVATSNAVLSGSANLKLSTNGSKILASGGFIVDHDTDDIGTSDDYYTTSIKFSQYVGDMVQDYVDLVAGVNIPAINRKAFISTAPNFTDEENPTITYSNPAQNAVTELQACIADSKGNTIYVPYRDISKTGTSYTFDLTLDERDALRGAVTNSSLALRFYVKSTIAGVTSYSFLDRTMTLEDIVPTLDPTVKDINTTTVALTGDDQTIILGYSDVTFATNAIAPAGTTIVNYIAKNGAQTIRASTGTFNNVETNAFSFSVMDGRGNVSYTALEMDVIPYIKVTCNQSVRLNLDGTIALVVKGNYFSDSFGAQNNTLKIEARSREFGAAWSAWGDISVLLAEASGGTYTLTATMSGFDPNGTYEFQARATDKLSSAQSTVDSVTLKPIFDWGKNDFNFNVPLTIEGDPLADYVIETGTEAMGTNGTWYWRKWRSGKAECYGCRNYGNMAVTTAWGGLFRSGAFTQSFPSGLFVSTPEVIDITFRGGSNVGGWIANHENSAPSESETGSFILVRPASATLTSSYLSFNIIGRWK